MWFNIKRKWRVYPYLTVTSVFLAAMIFNALRFGLTAFLVTALTFAASVAIVSRTNRRRLEERDYLEARVAKLHKELNYNDHMFAERAKMWFNNYLSVRQDRAAFFKALTAVFPAGYREERYLVDLPVTNEFDMNLLKLQWFLYIDLPEDLDLPCHQLRFVVNATEMKIIGELPDYTKERVTLLEGDSQHALRQYLANEAYANLKESSDGTAELAAA